MITQTIRVPVRHVDASTDSIEIIVHLVLVEQFTACCVCQNVPCWVAMLGRHCSERIFVSGAFSFFASSPCFRNRCILAVSCTMCRCRRSKHYKRASNDSREASTLISFSAVCYRRRRSLCHSGRQPRSFYAYALRALGILTVCGKRQRVRMFYFDMLVATASLSAATAS